MNQRLTFEKWREEHLLPAIFGNPDYQKAKAFGNFERFVTSPQSFDAQNSRFIQYGTPYTASIDAGGKISEGKGIGAAWAGIYDWLGLKKYGLTFRDDKERRSLAYLIARKRKEDGSYKFRNESAKTRIFEQARNESLPYLLEMMGATILDGFSAPILEEIAQINRQA